MWWKKEIDDHTTLIIMRIAVAVMYFFVSISLLFSSESNIIVVQAFKVISNFLLILAAITLFPIVESIYSKESKWFVGMLSITLSFFTILIMHVYIFNILGMPQTYGYILMCFVLNIISQFPIFYLVKKVYAKNT